MINWGRIAGVFLTTFCTAAIAIDFVSGTTPALYAAVLLALIHAGLAVGAELQDEGKNEGEKLSILNNALFL